MFMFHVESNYYQHLNCISMYICWFTYGKGVEMTAAVLSNVAQEE